ncbi:hypothetical protein K6V98_07285 [Collinsella sp. AGMB00827]|uniref:Uncharacterized protein n=1 Tax=Collinsella ureilytica TaxID=2869515 RepID=A0ABS7ML95_9ACTN|nr:hypothetical protein [Collinsella urealyticum]MBY4798146.1 hypothetical protein [Collinsella urealyticum]
MKSQKTIIVGALVIGIAAGSVAVVRTFGQGPAPEIARTEAARTESKKVSYKQDDTTDVLLDAEVNSDEIVKVVKHGDHWHVFTKDGREIITYSDPSLASNATDLKHTAKVVSADSLKHMRGTDVVRILKHGDHYHVYTADGREFITYSDPSAAFPGIAIGTYTGSHKTTVSTASWTEPESAPAPAQPGSSWHEHPATPSDEPAPALPGLSFVKVVRLADLKNLAIVRILQHADHYHAYTSDGTEYITYDDPSSAFPNITIGTYTGDHSTPRPPAPDPQPGKPGSDAKPDAAPTPGSESKPNTNPTPSQNPNDPKRVVKILHHEDHWHLILADGTELVTHTNPSTLYPGIPIGEYDPLAGKHLERPGADELFTYDEIKEGLVVPLDQITYGGVIYTIGFNKTANKFIVPHLDHYHNISIESLIQACKLFPESFGNHSAREIVATLKYLVRHPEARPKKEGWGHDAQGDQKDLGEFEEAPSETRKALRIIHDTKQETWTIYFSDGSTRISRTDPSSNFPGVTVLTTGSIVNPTMTDDEIIATWSKKYGITTDEFEEILLELPAAPLNTIVFREDRTVVINGETLPFRMPEQTDDDDAPEDEADKAESEHQNHGTQSQHTGSVNTSTPTNQSESGTTSAQTGTQAETNASTQAGQTGSTSAPEAPASSPQGSDQAATPQAPGREVSASPVVNHA